MTPESQSIRAATIVVFSNSSVHLENGRFVVTIVLLFSLRSEITLKQDIMSLCISFQAQCNGQVSFPSAGTSNHNHVLLILDELAGSKLLFKQRRDYFVKLTAIKFLHGFCIRKAGCFEPSPVLVLLPGGSLHLHKFQEKMCKIRRWICPSENLLVFCKRWYLQLLCIESNQFLCSIHTAEPAFPRRNAS